MSIKMRILIITAFFCATIFIAADNKFDQVNQKSSKQEIVLTGFNLTIDDIVLLANNKVPVRFDPEAWQRVKQSHHILLQAAKEGKSVYGLNRGVGLNKDKTLFEGNVLSQDAKAASIAFNQNNLRATCSAVGPALAENIVFSLMIIKLNSFIQGTTGAQPEVAELLLEFINRRIQPFIPSRGSIGEADITILAHIGLALMGEGNVLYQGEVIPASKALAINGLSPLVPLGKDSLSIMSSNAYSSALAALFIYDMERLLNKADLVFSLSLEGLDGNIAPFLEEVQNARPFEGQKQSAKNIRNALEGSSLWETSVTREPQDPLSFRSISQVHGTLRDLLKVAKQKFLLHLNSSDDNPLVVVTPRARGTTDQENRYYLKDNSGAVIPTANFETINWAIDFEALSIALSHLSHASTQRMLRLSSEKFTHLSRFLSPDSNAIVFGAIQKSFAALDAENKALSMPVSRDSVSVAGEIEDISTNLPLILQRIRKILDNLYYILGMELMHSSQAIDLRKKGNSSFRIGKRTHKLYHHYRMEVAFIEKDRPLSDDIERSYLFMSKKWPGELVPVD